MQKELYWHQHTVAKLKNYAQETRSDPFHTQFILPNTWIPYNQSYYGTSFPADIQNRYDMRCGFLPEA